MLVHLGQNYTALNKDIELVLDYNNIMNNSVNVCFLNNIKKQADTVYIDSKNTKSLVITKKHNRFMIYYSPIKPDTLLSRSSLSVKKSYNS